MFVLAGEMELAAEQTRHRILVDPKRVTQAVEIVPDDAEARVELVAAVVARIAEREQAVGVNLRVAEADESVSDRHVAVLDHDAGVAFPPRRVPRAHVVAAERPLDARLPERARHDSVELTASVERADARVRS